MAKVRDPISRPEKSEPDVVRVRRERDDTVMMSLAHYEGAKSTFQIMIWITGALSLAFVGAGIALVYLGATGTTELELFGLKVSSTNVGIVSIALGALELILLYRSAMKRIHGILALPPDHPRERR